MLEYFKKFIGIVLGMTFSINSTNIDKPFVPNAYYAGNTEASLSYYSFVDNQLTDTQIKERKTKYSTTVPVMSEIDNNVDKSDIKLSGTDNPFITKDFLDKWVNIDDKKDTSNLTMEFSEKIYIHAPVDMYVYEITPSFSSGKIPLLETYFTTGDGVAIKARYEDVENKTVYNIKFTNLERTWLSFEHLEGNTVVGTGDTIYYTDFDNNNPLGTFIKKGNQIAITGRTGGGYNKHDNHYYFGISGEMVKDNKTVLLTVEEIFKVFGKQ